ncbi:MAG: FAD-dependent oxidoreductase, partial [Candidatus Doudnabacteria bacterium]|nr:FAD-dependent oxidoreductase [Candidatus Doudnabacteria bacterium]
MSKYDYDLICIGSGSAGGSAAFVAKKAGHRVAIVEEFKDKLGGHCPNYACVPTKALLKAAQVYKMAKESGQFGIHADNPRFDFKEVAKYREDVVAQLTGSRIEKNLRNAGIDLLWGRASFVSDHELEIEGKKYSAENIVIATGSKEFIPPIDGLNDAEFWASDDAVKLDALPESVIIIGGGPIGTEFSQIFSGFDVAVTLLQRNDQILQREDREVAEYVRKDLEGRGVKIVTSCEIESVHKLGSGKVVNIKAGGKSESFEAREV